MSITLPVTRPAQSWEQYVKSIPPLKSLSLSGICERWTEFDLIERKDDQGKLVATDKRSKENGEQRAYLAWVTGAMEPEEEKMFGAFSLRVDALTPLAIVPVVREMVKRDERNALIIGDLIDRVKRLESAE